MSEYLLKTKIQNNLIVKRIKERGYRNITSFCKSFELSQTRVSEIVNFKEKPTYGNGKFRLIVTKIAEALQCDELDLFTNHQLTLSGVTAKEISIDEARVMQLMNDSDDSIAKLENDLDNKRLSSIMIQAPRLTDREKGIIDLRFNQDLTLDEVGKIYGISKNRVRDLESKALRVMRNYASRELGIKHSEYSNSDICN
jgi:RNA polymerase sigma factor (sigma-70 family)